MEQTEYKAISKAQTKGHQQVNVFFRVNLYGKLQL